MRVLALASYPIEAAATRYRLSQFVEPLAQRNIQLTIHPFINSQLFARLYSKGSLVQKSTGLLWSALVRLRDLFTSARADVVLIQREAMIFGPPMIEWLITRMIKVPMVLDLDDATYLRYKSPTYGAMAGAIKWFSKTDSLINWARVVTCGNRSIAEYVTGKHARAMIVPTVVDTDLFRPAERPIQQHRLVLGWIGTHSTFPYLESIFPVLAELAKRHDFQLKIVGSGKDVRIPNVEVENLEWKLDREIADFQSIDIGLYPIDAALYSGKWAFGKSGFKAIQYMAVGVPYVATPVGGSAEIGEADKTHFFASSADDWHDALEILISDANRRRTMGAAGRKHVVEHYTLSAQADKLAEALHLATNHSPATRS